MKTIILSVFFCFTCFVINAQTYERTTNDIASGYIIGSAVTSVACMANSKNPILYGIGSSLTLAVGKELYDKYYRKENFDSRDIFGVMVGGILGTFTVGIIIDKKMTPYYQLGIW